ncbi:MAG: S41 family peptidase [Pirellulaceae bacterium]|nr:S41 family peptidase [Pirellulaceae bacterium]
MPIRNLVTLLIVTVVCLACALQARNLKYGGKIGRAIRLLDDNFVESVDPQELYAAAMQGVVGKLDEFSEFIPADRYREFQSQIEQKFGGIGVQIEGPPAVRRLTVVTPLPKTPAFNAGMQAGDTILEIDGQSTQDLTPAEATKFMRGPVGTTVELLLQRMDSSETVRLKIPRADIEIDSVYGDRLRGDSTWDYFLPEDPRVAYIRIAMFGDRTTDEFLEALKRVREQAAALVIDLRFNPGGILTSAADICDMLLDEGVIVRTQGRRWMFNSTYSASQGVELDPAIPIVVLINQDSASASEIMAGCLQDLGRAQVAGNRSYGKGTVQQVFELESNRTALKFTTARFMRPSNRNIHRTREMTDDDFWGVVPDPALTMSLDEPQQIYLNRRWIMRSDPRLSSRQHQPPEPAFAADPQLKLVVQHLQRQLDMQRVASP